MKTFSRLPQHIGIIPDGNRRWALRKGLKKEDGYDSGLRPGLELYELCLELGIRELTFYGFTVDNTKRPYVQVRAFQKACVDAVECSAFGKNRDRVFPTTTKSVSLLARSRTRRELDSGTVSSKSTSWSTMAGTGISTIRCRTVPPVQAATSLTV
jgi:undecaprenyl pyrophosphate synthase